MAPPSNAIHAFGMQYTTGGLPCIFLHKTSAIAQILYKREKQGNEQKKKKTIPSFHQ